MNTDDPGALYRRWLFEVWYGELHVAEEIFAPDFVGHWPEGDVHGPTGVSTMVGASRKLFSDIENTIDVGPVVQGSMVAAHWTFRGSYLGGIPGATAETGTRIALRGSDMLRVADGTFAEYWSVSDSMSFMQQLGALPS